MNKNKIIIISVIVIIFIIVILFNIINKKNSDDIIQENSNTDILNSTYNEDTGIYELYDSNTNDIIGTFETKEGLEEQLKFYDDNPGYRATPPISPNAE